ncbi:MAG TPA: alcohol dehydrogenase catalytic domain-containing protein [Methylomirabilota bacterium]|jgi:L-iditol 2-dehydrogenase|nr:alcohol dehydrogenase catalytic domain-containing protein [Methylomirabilota bacterium]
MRAAVHAGAGEIRFEDRPTPAIGSGELLLRVRGCGLCGSDLAKLLGPAPRPAVLGHEVVGEVAAAGAGVAFRAGERVVTAHHVPCAACHYCRRGSPSMCREFKASNLDPGGFAEYVRVPAANVRHATFPVPDGMPDAVAAFTEPLGCCVRAVRRAGPEAGDTVVVAGLGAMGCLLVQLVRRRGARVIGIDPLPERRALGERLGADAAIAPEALAPVLAELSDGRGADLVLLTTGAPAVVRAALGWVRDGGAVHLFVGEGEGPLPVGDLYRRELTLTGTYSSSPADLAEAFELIRTGAVQVAPLCSHRLPLDRLAEAVELALRHRALKVFLEIGPTAGPEGAPRSGRAARTVPSERDASRPRPAE